MTSSIRSPAVDEFLDALDHPLKAGVEAIRLGILESNPKITERTSGQRRVSATLATIASPSISALPIGSS
jgi:hypothetical protein